MLRRALGVIVALVVTLGLLAEATPAAATNDPRSLENEFVWHLNALRAEKGLQPLVVDGRLTDVARDWAGQMAAAGRISHRSDLAAVAPDPSWQKMGENVGVGATVISLHDAFVASPSHYANLVDPVWQHVGIGVVLSGETIYVAVNFMQVSAPAAKVAAASASKAKASSKAPKKAVAKKPTRAKGKKAPRR
ncbi:MAG TPA: CAP domain-containing protein [Acidimicrobiales bacterium]|jgi:uncharacterized protein YkwD|nr:CAP domain-containing protein [Acidimicrobiales bacterium]